MKAVKLVNFTYDRKGKASYSSYNLTDMGKKVLDELAAVTK